MAKRDDTIGIRAIGRVESDLLETLVPAIRTAFGAEVQIDPPLAEPTCAYEPGRDQFQAGSLIRRLVTSRPTGETHSLGVTNEDLYAADLNFVFGLADPETRGAVISLARLRPEYYGQAPNLALYRQRAIKEAIHELGHTHGLAHCPDPKCIMHYSNNIHDTDIKEAVFCPKCERRRDG